MTPAEALAALDALKVDCDRCSKLRVLLMHAVGDWRSLVRKAARDDRDRDWSALIEKAEHEKADTTERAAAHLAEPHAAPTRAAARAVIRKPAPVDTRPECPRCGTRVEVNARGRLGAHRGPSGAPCPRRLLSVEIVAPPVSVPSTPKGRVRATKTAGEPSRLDVGSHCEDCGRWLPGERSVCGRCFVHRSSA